jgi:hypothetical protein
MAMTTLEKQVHETSRTLQAHIEKSEKGSAELRKQQDLTEKQVKEMVREMHEFRHTLAQDREERLKAEERRSAEFMAFIRMEMERTEQFSIEIAEILRQENERENERMEEFRNRMDKLNDDVGGIGSRFGDLLEIFIIPGIRPAVNKMGHDFKRVFPNKVVKDANFKVTQVDALLTNGAEAMAVEVKAHWSSTAYVDQHVNRLAKLRRYEAEAGLKGKILYGAVAGILIDKRVEEYAKKHGIYVVEIVENENLLKVRPPKAGQIRTW